MKKIILGLGLAVVLVTVNVADARTLSLGARGDDVAQLQTWLVNNGYPIPLIESGRASKGYFGTQTQDAVKMYQEGNEQNPTGVIDSTSYGNTSVKLGAATGPELLFPYLNFNGIKVYPNRVTLRQATTSVCSIKSPGATTTMLMGSIKFDTASTSATYLEVARAASAYATTTRIGSLYIIPAGAKGSIVASTTGSVAGDATIFPPDTYFNVKASWATAATAATLPVGSCEVMFAEL